MVVMTASGWYPGTGTLDIGQATHITSRWPGLRTGGGSVPPEERGLTTNRTQRTRFVCEQDKNVQTVRVVKKQSEFA